MVDEFFFTIIRVYNRKVTGIYFFIYISIYYILLVIVANFRYFVIKSLKRINSVIVLH